MNPTFSIVILLAIGSLSEAQHTEGISHGKNLPGDWIIDSCSGDKFLDANSLQGSHVHYELDRQPTVDSVKWVLTKNDGKMKGQFQVFDPDIYANVSCELVTRASSAGDRDIQAYWLNLCKEEKATDFQTVDRLTVHYTSNRDGAKCILKRAEIFTRSRAN